jgi:hypothetical protein
MPNSPYVIITKIKTIILDFSNHLPSPVAQFVRGTSAYQTKQMSRLYRLGQPLREPKTTMLFWVPGGMPLMLHVEGAIAATLRLRGINVHAVICDGPFRACVRRELDPQGKGTPVNEWQGTCTQCRKQTSNVLKSLGIPYSYIGDFVPKITRAALWKQTASVTWESLDDLSYREVNLGPSARSAIIRYLKGYDLTGHEEVVREYAYTTLVVAAASAAAFDNIKPARIFMSHAIYADWGPAAHTALDRGIPVSAWMASYLTAHFYFRHLEDKRQMDFHCLSRVVWQEQSRREMSQLEEIQLNKYFKNRYQHHISFDMRSFEQYVGDSSYFKQKYTLNPEKPIWGIITHVNWDAVSDYSPMAYDSFNEWLLDTVEIIKDIHEVQWLIKIHPAEASDNPKSGAQSLIERYYPSLPDNIRIIPSGEQISPLDFYHLVDGGVTVYGTPGLEMATLGKPVILAGEAHYGGKGFTYDALDKESYKNFLLQAGNIKPLSKEQQQLARRYAYCYFIQRQIPLDVLKDPESTWWKFQYDKRELLLPGKDPFMDFVCERILDGQDFLMDERLVQIMEQESH